MEYDFHQLKRELCCAAVVGNLVLNCNEEDDPASWIPEPTCATVITVALRFVNWYRPSPGASVIGLRSFSSCWIVLHARWQRSRIDAVEANR